MLTRHSLQLSGASSGVPERLFRRETLEQHAAAQGLIESAERQAAQLLEEARQRADDLVREACAVASAEFWQQAEAFLEGWREQQRLASERIVERAGRLVGQALTCLLDEVPQQERVHALLRQLYGAQAGDGTGELCCHPRIRPAVEDWLERRRSCTWRIREDDSLDSGSLRLVAEHGEFVLSWDEALTELLPRGF